MLLVSCGARKSQVMKSETESKTELEQETETGAETASEVKQVQVVTEQSGTFTPILLSQPMVIQDAVGNKTTVWNAKWETGTKKSETETTAKQFGKETAVSHTKAATQDKTVLKEKATERAESYSWLLGLLILIIALVVILYARRKMDNLFS